MTDSYTRNGTKYRRQRAGRSAWNKIREAEPKVHLLQYDRRTRIFFRWCDNREEPHGEDVPKTEPVTCKRCLHSSGAVDAED